MPKTFHQINVPKVGRSLFDLSMTKSFSGNMGYIYPSYIREVVPGDVINLSCHAVCRFLPQTAPILHEINLYMYSHFVPYRLLMTEELGDDGDFEDMIIGGDDGDTDITIPTWEPSDTDEESLWGYMGFPIDIDPDGAYPVDFPKRAYNMVWNEYWRDEIVTEIDITTSEVLKSAIWERDYLTTCRPWEQRGTSPAIPISGELDVEGDSADNIPTFDMGDVGDVHWFKHDIADTDNALWDSATGTGGDGKMHWEDPSLVVDVSNAVTIDINDLRLLIQTQRWMETNARAGTRYTSFLKAHFNVSPRDDRLDRPEMIGGMKLPVITSEVLQTESSDASTDLGTMAGHSITVGANRLGTYRVKEYGIIINTMCVRPRSAYQKRIDRQWRKDTLYDFYFPEFANLSEQAVLRSEVYATATEASNDTVFGYQGRYNEMRVGLNEVCGKLAYGESLDYWNMARTFSSAPTLSWDFLKMTGAATAGGIRNDVFAASSEHQFIIQVANIVKAARPMPLLPNPGLMDH